MADDVKLINELTTHVDALRDALRTIIEDIKQNRGERAVRLAEEALDSSQSVYDRNCAFCWAENISTVWGNEEVPVWPDEHPKHRIVTVSVPVRVCGNCKQMWTDHESEYLREKTVRESEPR